MISKYNEDVGDTVNILDTQTMTFFFSFDIFGYTEEDVLENINDLISKLPIN